MFRHGAGPRSAAIVAAALALALGACADGATRLRALDGTVVGTLDLTDAESGAIVLPGGAPPARRARRDVVDRYSEYAGFARGFVGYERLVDGGAYSPAFTVEDSVAAWYRDLAAIAQNGFPPGPAETRSASNARGRYAYAVVDATAQRCLLAVQRFGTGADLPLPDRELHLYYCDARGRPDLESAARAFFDAVEIRE